MKVSMTMPVTKQIGMIFLRIGAIGMLDGNGFMLGDFMFVSFGAFPPVAGMKVICGPHRLSNSNMNCLSNSIMNCQPFNEPFHVSCGISFTARIHLKCVCTSADTHNWLRMVDGIVVQSGCSGYRCLDRDQCYTYNELTKTTTRAHDSSCCDEVAADELTKFQYQGKNGELQFIR